jgi:sporulation protein YlmC with PRC-barrel domain
MLLNSSRLTGCPVLSLHLGGPIGRVTGEVVDPNDLKIIALNVDGPQTGDGDHGDILDVRSVREFSNIGMIIDSIDDLVSKGEVIKFDEIMDLNFSVIGLTVKTKKGKKLGKIVDYTFDPESMQIMQFIVKRPMMKSLLDPELVIGRSQIKEVNDYELIVKDDEQKIQKESGKKDFVPNFVNPFRDSNLATNEATVEEDEERA